MAIKNALRLTEGRFPYDIGRVVRHSRERTPPTATRPGRNHRPLPSAKIGPDTGDRRGDRTGRPARIPATGRDDRTGRQDVATGLGHVVRHPQERTPPPQPVRAGTIGRNRRPKAARIPAIGRDDRTGRPDGTSGLGRDVRHSRERTTPPQPVRAGTIGRYRRPKLGRIPATGGATGQGDQHEYRRPDGTTGQGDRTWRPDSDTSSGIPKSGLPHRNPSGPEPSTGTIGRNRLEYRRPAGETRRDD